MKTILAMLFFTFGSTLAAEPEDKHTELTRYVLTAEYRSHIETFELQAKNEIEAIKKLKFFYAVDALTVKPKIHEKAYVGK
jgi:hypothetical protein